MRLPLNCTVDYFPDFLSQEEADELYRMLIDDYRIDRARLTVMAGGRLIETDSFKFFFSTQRLIDANSHPEAIHGKIHPWTGAMAKLRTEVEALANHEFELAMCLFYPDGNFFAPMHNDQDTSGINTLIPSLSLGEVRRFVFTENETGEEHSLDLAHGSLLLMGKYCQTRYQHSLPKDPSYPNGRINITFREPGYQ